MDGGCFLNNNKCYILLFSVIMKTFYIIRIKNCTTCTSTGYSILNFVYQFYSHNTRIYHILFIFYLFLRRLGDEVVVVEEVLEAEDDDYEVESVGELGTG